MRALALMTALAALAAPATAALAQDCASAPEPVLSLSQGSRYAEGDATRSEIDADADAAANEALRPVDDFLRDLTERANGVFAEGADRAAIADCVTAQVAAWAGAGALTDLASETANLTVGSRLAGFALVLTQVLPHATDTADADAAKAWLAGLVHGQMRFWEEEAPNGAGRGNLRAWAALGAAATAGLVDDPLMRAWAAWSVGHVLCGADPDGSLPQEMSRGNRALHYQLHAIAPLVVATLILDRQGIALGASCDGALDRVVAFAVDDLATGEATRAITGEVQSFFDGTDVIEGFHLAWIEAYLILGDPPDRDTLEALVEAYGPLGYSKLGGDQTAIWDGLR